MATRDLFIGIDLHKDSVTLWGCDGTGEKVFCQKLATKSRNKIVRFFDALRTDWDRVCAAVESVGFYQWFWDLVFPLVDDLKLADASQVRAAAGRRPKTDPNDAATIARLLRQNSLPTAFVPDIELRGLRSLVRHRERLVRKLTSCKNSLRMEMSKLGLPGPRTLTTGTLHKWFTAQYAKTNHTARIAFEDLAEQLHLLERQIQKRNDELHRQIDSNPRFREPIKRIDSIIGVGITTAAVVYAESGGLHRFMAEKEIAGYAGLTPRVFQSDKTVRYGRISKAGPPIMRRCLVNAAWTAVRENRDIKRIFLSISRRTGKKRAIIAIARKMLVWAWAMERDKTAFDRRRLMN